MDEHMMLRTIRIALAAVFYSCITLLFLDFTGTAHTWLGWMAKVQFLPAVLALNVGVVGLLLLLTFLLGRVYCSVICPLGVLQDLISWVSGRRKGKRFRFSYSPELKVLRYGVLVVFVAALLAGLTSVASLVAPYSAYGRIAANLLAPIYRWGNQLLALLAEHYGSYAFYETEIWVKSLSVLAVAAVTLGVVGVLAWRSGRTYCNTVCPVGTVLGFVSRFALFRPVIDADKCNSCRLCAMKCKASCIDAAAHTIDYSRCVACMDCLGTCRHGALRFAARWKRTEPVKAVPEAAATDPSRRAFLASGAVLATAAVRAQEMKVDGGLAKIVDKQVPRRTTPILPPGAKSDRHFAQHCTACQLCVSACPNGVLRPSTDLGRLMQPEMSYERGYCRPECSRCSDVCPTGAIRLADKADKAAVQVGHAVVLYDNCISKTEGVSCGNCARHCPSGAIDMVPVDPGQPEGRRMPVVSVERCIGCGACEHLCPVRPFSAIYVEGHERQRTI